MATTGSLVGEDEPPAGSTVMPIVSPAFISPLSRCVAGALDEASKVPAGTAPSSLIYQSS